MDPIHSRKTIKQTIKGYYLFIKEIFIHPTHVGAILPSSKNLAQRMIDLIPYEQDTIVIELGAGTGAITQALLSSNIPNKHIIVIERSESLVKHLKKRFPQLTVIQGDAQDLETLIIEFKLPTSAIISSLPLRSLSKEEVLSIEKAAKNILMPQGVFIQFTYDLRKSAASPFLYFQKTASQDVWLNIPPARVDVYKLGSVEK